MKYLLEENNFFYSARQIYKIPITQYHCAKSQESLWDLIGQEIFTNFSAMFWFSRACSNIFFKTVESTKSSVKTVYHRYRRRKKNIRGNFNEQSSGSGFCHKSGGGWGDSFETSHQIEFLGLKIDNLMPSLRP